MEESYISYPETIEIDAVRADDDQYWRILRIHRILGYAQALAESMYLASYIKRMGTGTGEIIRLCKEARLKEPEFI